MKMIYTCILVLITGTGLLAQRPLVPDTVIPNYNDTLWKYVKEPQDEGHWNTLKNYRVTLTGTVCCYLGVDGNGHDCDSTFNISVKYNLKAQRILRRVIKENPSLPPCISTDNLHVEVICVTNTCGEYCKGVKYTGHHQIPAVGDSVAITGQLIADVHKKCELEIHPAWNIEIIKKGEGSTVSCCKFEPMDCATLRQTCKPVKAK